MPDVHPKFHFSATLRSDDIDVIAALRGLAWSCQVTGNKQVSSSGTGEWAWRLGENKATYFFTSQEYRDQFVEKALRLFPSSCVLAAKREDIAAPRQR
jgi:hypothetical protein